MRVSLVERGLGTRIRGIPGLRFSLDSLGRQGGCYSWVLEDYTLILFLVLGSYSSYLYLRSILFLFLVSVYKVPF